MKKTYIAPSLLSADFANLERDIKAVEDAGADILHLDVMDGHFVPNITFGPCVLKSIRKITKIPFDAHLMISNPDDYVEQFLEIGCQWLSFHIEAAKNPEKIIKKIKEYNCKAAIAIKPGTAIDTILPYLKELDMVLVMSVEPGFSGQKFMPEVLEKIKKLREHPDCPENIQVDGGINEETAKKTFFSGANIFVAGSYIFANDIFQTIQNLKKILK